MNVLKKIKLFVIVALTGIFLFGISNNPTKAVTYAGLGEVEFEWEREIYEGVNLTHTMSYNRNKEQKTYTIEFNPKTTALKPVVTTGSTVMGGYRMSEITANYESQGHHVVFGVNGDGYDTSNVIPSGIGINDGKLLNSSDDKLGWGITADGEVKYGSAKLPMNFTIEGGSTINLTHINKERKLNTSGVYLMTDIFSSHTNSTQAGVEVILSVDQGQDGIRIGEPFHITVDSVVEVENNPDKNKTPINKDKVVLSTHKQSPHYNTLVNLQHGQKITVNVDDNTDSRIDWSEIVAGMGIFHLLLDNGEETANLSNQDVHPRTAMGVKADGTIILMQNDGRQVGWANGFTFREMVEYMRDELGAVTVFNFDGGGSSTIQATIPGEDKARVLNRPSDGHERANANAFLLVATEEPTAENKADRVPEKIHIYPSLQNNYATKGMILEGGKMSFYVHATDANYYPAPATGGVTYRVESTGPSIGTIDNAGNFTATRGSATGRVIASMGELEAVFDLEVVDEISKIETDRTIISTGPFGTADLDFRAFKDGVPIILTTDSLTFALSPANLGTVSPSGRFTAAVESGGGSLTVTYKEYSLVMPIEIGKLPVQILDFERDIFADNSWVKYYTNMPGNGGTGNISINNDERYVKHGDGSLRIDYDFATTPLTGTVSIEIGQAGFTKLEGQPTAIGVWVYGDGNGGWFRIQLSGGKYAGDTRIDWVGWKYIETPIPIDAPFPYVVQRAVRLIGTGTIANNKAGTIYVDSVRAIYDYKNDDNSEPVVFEESISPAQGATTENRQQVISLKVKDSDVAPVTGMDISRTQMFINNKQVSNIQQIVNPDGSVDISYNPSALDKLRPGVQNVRVRVEDNFGNKKFIEWSFILEGYSVNLTEEKPDKDIIYAGEEFTYKIDTPAYTNFDQVEVELSYNANSLELLEHKFDDRLVATNEEINETTGKIKYTLIGMSDHNKGDATLFEFKFRAKEVISGTTAITVDKAVIVENSEIIDLVLEGYSVDLAYQYLINVNGTTYDRDSLITLTKNQVPVEGIKLLATKNGSPVVVPEELLTDNKGQIQTDFFNGHDIGTKFKLYFMDQNGLYSNQVEITILASLGTHIPEKVVVTVGEDSAREVGISYQTNHEVIDGKVWISLNEDMSNPTVIDSKPTTIYTYHSNADHEYTSWGAFINGLNPDTRYYYQVGSDLGKSETFSFKTPKTSGDMDVAVYGDIQGGFSTFGNIQGRLNEMYPNIDLNLIVGDVADNAHIYNDWTQLSNFSKQYFANGIWSSAIGNHDVTDDGLTFANYFYGPLNGVENDIGARNYYFTFGDAIFFNFDTEAYYNSYDPNYTKQKALLLDVMANTDKTFKIVIMHRSAYPLNYDEANIRALAPTFEAAGIDLVLSGHDHTYNRVTMLNGVKQETFNGVTYLLGGTSSGAKYYDGDHTRPWAGVVYDDNNPVFMILKFRDGKRIEYESYAVEGGANTLIDSFIIEKNNVVLEEENFTYEGPLGVTTGGRIQFKIKADTGYYVEEVKVNGQVINYNLEGFYVASNVVGDAIIEVTLKEGYNIHDINNDSVVTKADAIAILKHITGNEEVSSEYLALLGLTYEDLTLEFARTILAKVGDQ